MKCPHCVGKFSELRDVCPDCGLDLRDYKASKGIKISFPGIAYADLVKKFPPRRQKLAPAQQQQEHQPDPTVALFGRAAATLPSTLASGALGTADLGRAVVPAEIQLLFDVLDDVFVDTDRFTNEIQASDAKSVEAPNLQAQLDQIAQLSETPLITLKKSGASISEELQAQSASWQGQESWVASIGAGARAIARLVDALHVCVAAIALGMIFAEPSRDLFVESLPDVLLIYGDALAIAAGIVVPLSILYILVAGVLLDATIGIFLVGGRLADESGKEARFSSVVLHALLAPLAWLTSGVVPMLFGCRGWHEKIAGTRVIDSAGGRRAAAT